MKAIIEVDVPNFQIGQEVSIYFKDTMMIKGVVQEPKILDKIRAEIQSMSTDYCGGYIGLDKQEVLKIIDKHIGGKE